METILELGDLRIAVVHKPVKHLHLSVLPPEGDVRITAPEEMELESIRLFAIDKIGWIRKQQNKFRRQVREVPREALPRESHYLWGQRYLLQVKTAESKSMVEIRHREIWLYVPQGTPQEKRLEILEAWYRQEVKSAAARLLLKWEQKLGVKIEKVFVRKMKTKWGSSNPEKRTIRLNTELAKKPLECLEYVLVHELVHFIDHTHGEIFTQHLNMYLPNWKSLKSIVNEEVSSCGV